MSGTLPPTSLMEASEEQSLSRPEPVEEIKSESNKLRLKIKK